LSVTYFGNIYIASLLGSKWYMEILLLGWTDISLPCARFMWKFIYQQTDVQPAYLSVPNRETSEISTVAVLTQLSDSRLVCDFESETYSTPLHFWSNLLYLTLCTFCVLR